MFTAQLSLLVEPELPNWIIRDTHPDFMAQTRRALCAKLIGLDCETYGERKDDALNPRKGQIRLIQIAFEGICLVVDLGGWMDDRGEIYNRLDDMGFWGCFYKLLRSEKVIKVAHNAHFDFGFIRWNYGIEARRIHCTQLLSQILGLGRSFN